MGNYRAQCSVVTTDNVAANFATNTLYFEAVDDTDLTDITVALVAMYSLFGASMNNLVKGVDNLIIKYYDMADPLPRVPVEENDWTFTRNAAAATPPEVTLVMSFQGTPTSGVSQARRRGRIYVPFIGSTAIGGDGRPTTGCIDDIEDGGISLKAASNAAADWTWQVYSPTSLAYTDVVNGWVDNEFDTQRRRGRPATSRRTF